MRVAQKLRSALFTNTAPQGDALRAGLEILRTTDLRDVLPSITQPTLVLHGEKDAVVPPKDVNTLVEKLKTQKGIVIDQQTIPGANHFFEDKMEPLMETITSYLDMRLANVR